MDSIHFIYFIACFCCVFTSHCHNYSHINDIQLIIGGGILGRTNGAQGRTTLSSETIAHYNKIIKFLFSLTKIRTKKLFLQLKFAGMCLTEYTKSLLPLYCGVHKKTNLLLRTNILIFLTCS